MSHRQTVTFERPDPSALITQANISYALAESYVIDSDLTLALAVDDRRAIKARISELDERRKAITRPLDVAKAETMALFRPAIDRLTDAVSVIDGAILTYQQEQERKRLEEQARLEAAARAERERVEAEARRQAEEAARLAAEAAQATDAEQAAALQARAEEAAANAAAAETLAELVVAPAAVEATKVAGLSTRGTLQVEVTDKLAFLAHIVANPSLVHLVVEDGAKLRAYARALGAGANIPGVKISEKQSVATRKAAR